MTKILREQIYILQVIKEERQAGLYDSPYVCDNIQCRFGWHSDEVGNISHDIKKYIQGEFCVRSWLSKKNGKFYSNEDKVVEVARIKMIDTLIERYTTQLEEMQ